MQMPVRGCMVASSLGVSPGRSLFFHMISPSDGPVQSNGRKQPPSGSRIKITRLMFKLQAVPEPNYVIAASLGIHPYTLSQYSRGSKPISAKHLERICKLFECEPEEILGLMEVEVA